MYIHSVPTVKTLSRLPLDKYMVKQCRATIKWYKESTSVLNEDKVDFILEYFNTLLNGHGIEFIRNGKMWSRYYHDMALLYVNTGDTYSTTFAYDVRQEKFIVTSWGDWFENEKKQGRYQEP